MRRLTTTLAGGLLTLALAACGGAASPAASAPAPAASAARPSSASPSPRASVASVAPASPLASASGVAPATPLVSSSGAAPSGQFVYAASSLQGGTLDPSQSPSNLMTLPGIGAPIFEQLFTFQPPDGKLRAFLLESYAPAADGMSWTFKLRPGIKFSNGDPMTADDVKFSIDKYLAPDSKTTSSGTLRNDIASVDVVDPLTVRVNLKRVTVDLPLIMSNPGTENIVFDSKYYQQVGGNAFSNKPVGSGPYVFSSAQPGQQYVYTANPNYWGGPTGKARPVFQQLTIQITPEEQTRIAMLKQGAADLVPISADSVKDIEAAGFKTVQIPEVQNYMIYFEGEMANSPDSPLKKVDVRHALTIALDKKALLDGLYGGRGSVVGIAPPSDVVTNSPNLPPTPYDPAQAKQLLAQAGYPNGFDLKLQSMNTCGQSSWAEAVASYWQKIGVRVQVIPTDFATFRPKIFSNPVSPDVNGTAWTFCTVNTGGSAVTDLTGSYYSKSGVFHLTDVADAEVEQVLNAKTLADQTKAVAAVYQKVTTDYSAIGVFTFNVLYGAGPKAQALHIIPAYNDVMQWWVSSLPPAS